VTQSSLVLDSVPMEKQSGLYESVRSHYLFSGLEEEDFDRLAAEMKVRDLDQGEVLFHRGDPADSFFYVDTGLIELSLISATGDKKTLEVVNPGRTFGEAVTFMQEVKFPVTAEGLHKSKLCEIPNRAFLDMLRTNRDACMRLLADLSRHLHARVREIENLSIQNARHRLSSYIIDHITDARDGDQATARLELPRHVIASRLSIKPETLSRLLRSLADEGVISIEDRIVFIHSLSRLRPYD
jgi:CRP-like cAMP-binding protein